MGTVTSLPGRTATFMNDERICANPDCGKPFDASKPGRPGPKPKYHDVECRLRNEARRNSEENAQKRRAAARGKSLAQQQPRKVLDAAERLETLVRDLRHSSANAADVARQLHDAADRFESSVKLWRRVSLDVSPNWRDTPDQLWLKANRARGALRRAVAAAEAKPNPETFQKLVAAQTRCWDVDVEFAAMLGVRVHDSPSPSAVPQPEDF